MLTSLVMSSIPTASRMLMTPCCFLPGFPLMSFMIKFPSLSAPGMTKNDFCYQEKTKRCSRYVSSTRFENAIVCARTVSFTFLCTVMGTHTDLISNPSSLCRIQHYALRPMHITDTLLQAYIKHYTFCLSIYYTALNKLC